MNWHIGPWIWDTSDRDDPRHRGPTGTRVAIDFRNLAQQSKAGESSGLGLFLLDGIIADDRNYLHLGSGSWHDIKSDQRMRDAFPRRAGYALTAPDLVGLVYESLTAGSAPDGSDGARPLMPNIRGQLVLRCGQQYTQRFKIGRDQHANRVRDVLRADFRKAFESVQAGRMRPEQHRRLLDFWCDKYRVRKDEWQQFVPHELRAHVPGVLPHETTVADDFDRADESPIGAPWTGFFGTGGRIVSNEVQRINSSNNGSRHTTALSSDDHYAEIDTGSASSGITTRALARCSDSAVDAYGGGNITAGNVDIEVYSAGTPTTLASVGFTFSAPDAFRIECDGSTIKAYLNGVEHASVTNSAITGNLYCGFRMSGSTGRGDNFIAEDLGGGGGGILYTQLERDVRGVNRGVYTDNRG